MGIVLEQSQEIFEENQYIMEPSKVLEKRQKEIIKWAFVAPMHDKPIVNGIGGFVKRYVRPKILSQSIKVSITICKL